MKLMKQVMAILEKMNYNEWPSKITYERQHMAHEWARVRINVDTEERMELIETALKTYYESMGLVAPVVAVETKAIKRGGRIIHYRIYVHRTDDNQKFGNLYRADKPNPGPEEKPYMVCTKKMLNAFVSLAQKKATGVLVFRMEFTGADYPLQMHLTSEFRDECLDAHDAEGVAV